MKITTSESNEKESRQLTLDYDFGNTLPETIEKFGDAICHNHVTASFKVAIQGNIRRLLKLGTSDKDILLAMDKWEPGMKKEGKSPGEKAKDAFGRLSDDERKAFLKELKAGNV